MRRVLVVTVCVLLCAQPAVAPVRVAAAERKGKPIRDDGIALPDSAGLERLARTDPVGLLRACLRRYDREVKGYSAILHKQERIDGRLRPSEEIRVAFREHPFSVLLVWLSGPSRAARVLYVEGQYDNQLLVLPAGALAQRLVGVVRRDPNGAEARQAGRYTVPEFGIRRGMERVLAAWDAARKAGELHVEYLGTRRIAEAGNRSCYVLRSSGAAQPGEEGVTVTTIFVDTETWLQVGTILKGQGNRLIAEYFFRDVRLNPDFPPDTFTPRALQP
jgi:hypothetical protein